MGFMDVFRGAQELATVPALRERLQLAKERMEDALQKFNELATENESLRGRVEQLEAENLALKGGSSGTSEVCEEEIAILKCLAELGRSVDDDIIYQRAGIANIERARFFLGRLADDREYIGVTSSMGGPLKYYLCQEGRAFLFKHGHI